MPLLRADSGRGTGGFAVDLPRPTHRATIRRGGFGSEDEARAALRRLPEGPAVGFSADPNQSPAGYHGLARDQAVAAQADDLCPLPRLRDQRPHSRARSGAFGRARIRASVRVRARLEYCHGADPLFADLVELIIGTGMRKGEALGLQRNDVDLAHRVLFVRQILSAVDNNHLSLGAPKTRTSRNWVAVSDRVAAALERRAREHAHDASGRFVDGYVFTRFDGEALHPEYVLNHFYRLCDNAGVTRCAIHDLTSSTAYDAANDADACFGQGNCLSVNPPARTQTSRMVVGIGMPRWGPEIGHRGRSVARITKTLLDITKSRITMLVLRRRRRCQNTSRRP